MASASRLKNYGLRPGFGLELCGLVAALFCRKKLLRVKVFACFLCTCELRSSWENIRSKRTNHESKSGRYIGQSLWRTRRNEWHLKCNYIHLVHAYGLGFCLELVDTDMALASCTYGLVNNPDFPNFDTSRNGIIWPSLHNTVYRWHIEYIIVYDHTQLFYTKFAKIGHVWNVKSGQYFVTFMFSCVT